MVPVSGLVQRFGFARRRGPTCVIWTSKHQMKCADRPDGPKTKPNRNILW